MKRFMIFLALPLLFVLCVSGPTSAEPRTGTYWPVLNIKASSPQIVSLELGMSYQFREDQSSDTGIGPFISYEPGINGQKAHLGIAYTHFTGSILGSLSLFVVKLSASYYQAWQDSKDIDSGDKMYGAEITGTYKIFLASGGIYYNRDKDEYVGTIGAGVGW